MGIGALRRYHPKAAEQDAEAQTTEAPAAAAPPAGNATQEAWAEWVIATHPELDEVAVRAAKRDELRDQYGPKQSE